MSAEENLPLQGGCLCGGVRFELTKPFRRANHCHCSLCRRHSGTFGLTQGRVPRDGFRLLQGEELVRVYRPPDGTSVKAFCSVCGSSLFGGTWPEGPEVSVRFGSLDGDPGMLSFDLEGGREAGRRFIEATRVAKLAASLGSTETLVSHPASTTHRQFSPEALAAAGIGEGMVRVSVGLEDADDLADDFTRALEVA